MSPPEAMPLPTNNPTLETSPELRLVGDDLDTEPIIEAMPEPAQNETLETVSPEMQEDFVSDQAKKEREIAVENIRREQVRSGIIPIYNLSESGEFSQEEILQHIGPWVEKYSTNPENISEVLSYFELVKGIISTEFSPDRRVEVVCAFADVIAEGHMDAETLAMLVSRIEPAGEAEEGQAERDGYEGISFFQQAEGDGNTKVLLLEKFFQQNESGSRVFKIAHMLKHEIGHSLIRYGEVLSQEEIAAINHKIKNTKENNEEQIPKISTEVWRIIDQARNDQHIQTQHLSTVLAGFEKLKHQDGISENQVQQRATMVANQIMAEKIGLYLSSNGEFEDFLRANIEVTSDENLSNIFATSEKPEIRAIISKIATTNGEERAEEITELRQQCPGLVRFIESNKVFFDLANSRLQNKDDLKKRIETNIADDSGLGDDEDEFFGYYEGGFYEPGTPSTGEKTTESRSKHESWLSISIELAGAFSTEAAEVVPVTELTKNKAA